MATDTFQTKKRRSLGRKTQLNKARAAKTAPAPHCSADKENVNPAPLYHKIKRLEVKLALAESQAQGEKAKTTQARAQQQNTRRREDRAKATNVMLCDQLESTRAIKDNMLALQLEFNKSRQEVGVLLTRNSTLVKRAKVLAMRIRRAPTSQARVVEKVKAASRLFKLQEKGVIMEASRELVTDLVSLHNVPVSRVLAVVWAVVITFPDTSNTRYQSHCETAGVLLLHRELFTRYLEHMRDRKASRSFTNVEKNVYDGLLDPATNTELLVLAAYGQAISRPYLAQVRGPNCEYTNVLDLGPLHERVKEHCRAIIANHDLLLAPDASYVQGSMDGRLWDNPEIMYKIQSISGSLPRVRECLVVFFAGALETWVRFSVDYEEGGTIANLTPAQRERANMTTTNDANEGTLGERRTGSRHAPNMSLHQHNARKMYKRNDTRLYRRRHVLEPKMFRVFRTKARMVDSSGLTRRNRKAQQDFNTAAVEVKHAKDKVKVAKVKAVTAMLDKVTPWLTVDRVRLDPATQKEPTNKELDVQLAWHRRTEGPLPNRVRNPPDFEANKQILEA